LHIEFLKFAKLYYTADAANNLFNFAKTIPVDLSLVNVQKIEAEWLTNNQVSLDVLRLDKIDPVISGNKWFKLKYHLEEVAKLKKAGIATFGGAWSNHIIATAYAAKQAGLKSIGIIRGEKPTVLSHTLSQAIEYGMEMHFVSREQYRRKEEILHNFSSNNWYWIEEGGYGTAGVRGASEILSLVDTFDYSHIIAAVGTGTMLAGLILARIRDQKVIGISSMKGNFSLGQQIKNLIEEQAPEASFEIKHEYHFGGYGRHPETLINFINNIYLDHNLPLDIIYTGKTFFAIKDMAEKRLFKQGSNLLMIHSGGLQGNRSLQAKVLAF
jgi:1-aminocyclopropane-1-carboxylate deaminase